METIRAERLVRTFYKMMDDRALPKTEIIGDVTMYRANLLLIGFHVDRPSHMKRGSEVMQLTKMLDEEVTTAICTHRSEADFRKWLDLWK